MIRLGVNVDHVATLRQQRRASYPDPAAEQVRATRDAGAVAVELHTGDYANAGHAIVARAVLIGMAAAVREMKAAIG